MYSVGGHFCLFVLFNYELFSFSARIVPEMHFFRSDKESTQFQKVPKLRAFLAIIGDKYEVTTFGFVESEFLSFTLKITLFYAKNTLFSRNSYHDFRYFHSVSLA